MIPCPQCRHGNPAFVLHCGVCQARMWTPCRSCSAQLPLGARFCGMCAEPQGEPSPERLGEDPGLIDPELRAEAWFKGRTRELSRATAPFREALKGRGQAILVSGPPGIGKSALLQQLVIFARQNGFAAFQLRSRPGYQLATLGVFHDLVAQLCGIDMGAPPEVRKARLVEAQLKLGLDPLYSDILGDWFDIDPERPVEPPPPSEHRLAALRFALIQLLAAMSRKSPLALAIDDLQWSDTPTRNFIWRLVDAMPEWRGVLMLATREAPGETVKHALQLPLRGMDSPTLAALVSFRLRIERLPREIEDNLEARTGGNPLAALEFTQLLFDRQAIEVNGGLCRVVNRQALTQSALNLEELFHQRYLLLPAEQRRLATAAALLDVGATTEAIAAVVGDSDAEVGLHALLERGVLARSGADVARYRVPETALRELLWNGMREGPPAELHRAVLAYFDAHPEARPRPGDVELAAHLLRIPQLDLEETARAEVWADILVRRYQPTLAAQLLQKVSAQLQRAAPEVTTAEERTRMEQKICDIQARLARLFRALVEREKATRSLEISYQIARRHGWALAGADSLLMAADMAVEEHRWLDAERLLAQVCEIADTPNAALDNERARAFLLLGRIREEQKRYLEAVEAYRNAAHLAPTESMGPRFSVRPAAFDGWARVLLAQRNVPAAAPAIRMAVDAAREEEHPLGVQAAYERAAQAETLARRADRATKLRRRAIELARRGHRFQDVARLAHDMGSAYVRAGAAADALDYLSEAQAFSLYADWRAGVDMARTALSRLHTTV